MFEEAREIARSRAKEAGLSVHEWLDNLIKNESDRVKLALFLFQPGPKKCQFTEPSRKSHHGLNDVKT